MQSAWEHKKCTQKFIGKPEGKWALEKSRNRWEDSIKIDFEEIWCESMNWIGLAGYRLVLGSYKYGNEHSDFINKQGIY